MKIRSRCFAALSSLLVATAGMPIESALAETSINKNRLTRSASPGTNAQPEVGNRTMSTTRPGFDRSRPLEGKVERQEGSDFAGRKQLRTGASSNGLNGGQGEQNLGTGIPAYENRPRFDFGLPRTHLAGDISDKEIKLISNYDVVVMQDRSSSMGEDENILLRNGMGMRRMSRWDWCLSETADFTRQTSFLPNWAFTLVLFSSKYDVFHRVAFNQLPAIYNRTGIYIGTKLAEPMAEQISMYFRRRQMGEKRSLLVAVITDGKPQDDENLRDLLIQTTYQMRDPEEVKVVFLQVGTSDEGSEKLFKLDRKLQAKGAKYDIVTVKPFYEIANVGLTRALLDTICGGR
jgi:Mg-chelatase subunit ChlD